MIFGFRQNGYWKILVVLFFSYVLFSYNVGAVEKYGSSLINNYYSYQYRASSQNWAIVEDHRGIMYIANNDGVLEYDGVSWNLIRLPDNKPATALAFGNDEVIYVGSHSEFGFLKPCSNGKLVYESLLHLFPEDEQEFSFVWKIASTTHGVFFNNYDSFYHLKDSVLTIYKPEKYSQFFDVNDHVYLFDASPGKGLKYFDGNDLIPFSEENSLSDLYIMTMHSYNEDKIFISCASKGFYLINNILDKPELEYFEPEPLKHQEAFDSIIGREIMSSVKLKNGNYAFATILDGVYIINRDGSLNKIINKNTGLQNQTANNLHESNSGVLWMALDNGVSSANINYPMAYWSDASGYVGSILDIIRFGNEIYISTWQGVYRLIRDVHGKDSSAPFIKFQIVEGISARAWSFLIFEDKDRNVEKLLVATSRGIYDVSGNSAELVVGDEFITLKEASQNKNIILCGFSEGLALLYYDEDIRSFLPLKLIEELRDYEIVEVLEDKPGMFWLSHRSEGISAIRFDNLDGFIKGTDEVSYEVFHFGNEQGIPDKSSLHYLETEKGIVFYTASAFFVYKENNNIDGSGGFLPISEPINHYLSKRFSFTKISIDEFDNGWMQIVSRESRERRFFLIKDIEKNNYNISDFKLLPIRQTGINRIFIEEDGRAAWFGGDDALFKVNLDILTHESDCNVYPLIRSIKVNGQSIYSGAEKHNQLFYKENKDVIFTNFKHSDNSFSFDYAYPDFFDPTNNLYSIYLKNYDKSWSGWSYETSKTYNNLPPGEYLFLVKAMDSFGNISETTGYAFSISYPWHKTQTALIIYLLTVIVLIYAIIRTANRQLVKAKNNLEKIVRERTSEIVNQRKKLEIEKEKSDKLLRNILPFKIAQELKTYGNVRAQYYDMATVMFMDFKDFSKTSQFINPLHLLSELDCSFGYFDEVCARHNLEKIKTIGDAYMCAGGIPLPNMTNPFDAILAAFEIVDFVRKAEKNQWLCELRLGVHTGELIAGIIGKNKFAYDIWGETVNTASRLETTGEVNRINISGETYSIVKDYFVCTYRGRLPAKHSDEYQMYFVNRIKKEYSADAAGKKPNKEFIDIILNMK